jgi:hypothetical protein
MDSGILACEFEQSEEAAGDPDPCFPALTSDERDRLAALLAVGDRTRAARSGYRSD